MSFSYLSPVVYSTGIIDINEQMNCIQHQYVGTKLKQPYAPIDCSNENENK